MRDRQHRYTDLRIFFFTSDRERPEVRWRPDENNQKQQQRTAGDFTGYCCPAQHGWCCARGAADNDVLRGRAFQENRIDDGIANQRSERQNGGQRIDQEPQNDHRDDRQYCRERQGGAFRDPALRQWSTAGAQHVDVDACVEDVVVDSSG